MDRSRAFAALGENWLLERLPADTRRVLDDGAQKVPLALRDTLIAADQPIEHVYFPLAGMVSLVVRMGDGLAVEVATIGNEGYVGSPVFLGADRSPITALCQVPGEALRVPVAGFRRALGHAALHELVRRSTQALITQIAQTTACNYLHSVQERMCRWLLMTQDRVQSDELALTQEFLSQMLGVRRPSVTVEAGILQSAGLIEYRRGRIRVLDRARLEEGACECYGVVRKELERLLGA